MQTISLNEAVDIQDKVFIDVRTPLEFSRDHITGAVNIPVLSDEQRALVGTMYKHESQKQAVDVGVAFFSEKLPKIIAELRKYEGKTIIAYCWRGGMRSKAFVSFLHSLKFDIVQLEGGYKSFRQYVREALYDFDIKPAIYCIYGMTGTGKTDIINKLTPKSIDLEGLAQHRSSIFGHVGLSPRTQKMFENMLLAELIRVNDMPYIFLEGESRKIGNINIPGGLFDKMINCNIIKVHSDMTVRTKRIVSEYFDSDDKISSVREVLDSYVLKNKLGNKNIEYLKECLEKGDHDGLVQLLLEKYYDPMYMHSQKRFKDAVEFDSDNIEDAVFNISAYANKSSP